MKYKTIDTGTGAIFFKVDPNTTVMLKNGVYQIRQEINGVSHGVLLNKDKILALVETIKDM